MANLYDKAGLVNIPVGYQDGFLYNIKPEDNTLGFRFNRDSAATRVNKEGLIEQVGYFGPELVQNGNFSELGSELIPDGNFTNQAAVDYWQIADTGGVERATKSLENGFMRLTYDIDNGSALYKTGIGVSGKSYKVTFRAKGTANSSFNSIGDLANISSNPQYVVSNPTLTNDWQNYEFYVPVSSTTFRLYLTSAQIGDTLDITNISIKQVDPNDYWTLGTGWSIVDNKAIGINATSNLQQSISVTSGSIYKVSFYVSDYVSGQVRLQTNQQNSIVVSANGTYVQYLTMTSDSLIILNGIDLNPFNGSVSNISVTEVLGDKPRIDYTDSLTSPSFLLEPQSTNLLTFSENLKNYENSNTICTSNYAISPDGTKNATRVDFTASSTNALGVNGAVNNGETVTQSVFVKYIDAQFVQLWFGSSGFNGGNTNFDLINGTTSNPSGSSSTMKNMGNGWWRISSTRTATSTSGNTGVFKLVVVDSLASSRFGDEANGSVLVFGGQYEQKSYPTSYIPTAGSTVTRAQETCNGAGNASTFNDSEGVLYAEIAALADDLSQRHISVSNGSDSDVVRIHYYTTSNSIRGQVRRGGVIQASLTYIVPDIKDFHKVAISYKENDVKLYIDGVLVLTDTSASMPTGLAESAFDNGNGVNPFYGKTKGVYVFNEALTDDELQQLTGPEYNSFAALAAAYNYTVI